MGERIKALMDDRDQTKVAKRAQLSASTFHDAMTRKSPGADKILKIAQALGTTVEYLMTGHHPPPAFGSVVAGAQRELMRLSEPSPAAPSESPYEIARRHLENAMQQAGLIPSESVRQALIALLARCDVPPEYIADLLIALKRPGDPVK